MPGKAGMKWGFNDGVPNGRRKALEDLMNGISTVGRSSSAGSNIDTQAARTGLMNATMKGYDHYRKAKQNATAKSYYDPLEGTAKSYYDPLEGTAKSSYDPEDRNSYRQKSYQDAMNKAEYDRNVASYDAAKKQKAVAAARATRKTKAVIKQRPGDPGTPEFSSNIPGRAGTPEFNKKFNSAKAIVRRNKYYTRTKNDRIGKSDFQNLISDIKSDKGKGLGREIANTVRNLRDTAGRIGGDAKEFYNNRFKRK